MRLFDARSFRLNRILSLNLDAVGAYVSSYIKLLAFKFDGDLPDLIYISPIITLEYMKLTIRT